MKTAIPVFLLLPVMATAQAPVTDVPVSLAQAIEIARRNQGSVASAKANVEASRQVVVQARTGNLPIISGGLGYSVVGRNRRLTNGGFASIQDSSSGIQPQVAVDYTVFDSGLTSARVAQARESVRAAEASLTTTYNDLSYIVAAAYFGQLEAEKLLNLRVEQERLAEEQLQSVDAQIEVESAAPADRALPLSEYRNRQVDTIAARNDLAIAANNLRNAMGLPVGERLQLIEENLDFPETLPSLDTLQKQAQMKRPEALRARAQYLASRQSINVAKIGRLPSLNTTFRSDLTPESDSERRYWEVGASISMPLFDFGSSRAQEQQARANTLSDEAVLEQTIKDVAAEVTEAYNNLQSSLEREKASQLAVDAAKVNLDQTTERYQLGASGISTVALVQAQVQFATASNNAIQARYDVELSKVQLNRAIGVYGNTETGNQQ